MRCCLLHVLAGELVKPGLSCGNQQHRNTRARFTRACWEHRDQTPLTCFLRAGNVRDGRGRGGDRREHPKRRSRTSSVQHVPTHATGRREGSALPNSSRRRKRSRTSGEAGEWKRKHEGSGSVRRENGRKPRPGAKTQLQQRS